MGSTSDWEVMSGAAEMLQELGIDFEKRVVSAHRTPDLMYEYAHTARQRGIGVICRRGRRGCPSSGHGGGNDHSSCHRGPCQVKGTQRP